MTKEEEKLKKFLESNNPEMTLMGVSLAIGMLKSEQTRAIATKMLGKNARFHHFEEIAGIPYRRKIPFTGYRGDPYERGSIFLPNKIFKRAVRPLIKILKDESKIGMLKLTAKALSEIGDKRAVKPLIEILEKEKENLGLIKIIAKAILQIEEVDRSIYLLGHGPVSGEDIIRTLVNDKDPEMVRNGVSSLLDEYHGVY